MGLIQPDSIDPSLAVRLNWMDRDTFGCEPLAVPLRVRSSCSLAAIAGIATDIHYLESRI
jgi:hypothetical protein